MGDRGGNQVSDQQKCAERIAQVWASERDDFARMIARFTGAWVGEGAERFDSEYGILAEYGLSFSAEKREDGTPYRVWQLSTGGPHTEIRLYADSMSFVLQDWWDGAELALDAGDPVVRALARIIRECAPRREGVCREPWDVFPHRQGTLRSALRPWGYALARSMGLQTRAARATARSGA